jgi:excisionase family DNA binding protein
MGNMIGDLELLKNGKQEFLSIEEVSKYFQLSIRTISKLIAEEELRYVRWGKYKRIPLTSVLYYLTRQGIMFPSEFDDERRKEIYEAEKNRFDIKKSLTVSMDSIIKRKAVELINESDDFSEYRNSEAFSELFKFDR